MAIDRHKLMHSFHPLTALVVGEKRAAEFDAGLATLRAMADTIEVTDLVAAERCLGHGAVSPDLVVLVQDRPGEYAPHEVLRLRRAAPLARFIGLMGSWCEGEPRTGAALPGVLRVYWYDAAARFAESIGRLASGRCPAWGLPLTASDDELLLATASEPAPQENGLVILAMRHFDAAEPLAEACRSRGYAAVWLQSAQAALVDGATAIVWDGSDMSPSEVVELSALVRRFPTVPVIAVLDFPRFDTAHRSQSHGASCVLGRPLLLDDLFWQIAQFASHTEAVGRAIDAREIGQSRVGPAENAA